MTKTYQPDVSKWPDVTFREITLDDKIAEIRAELTYRQSVYERMVNEGKMRPDVAARRTAIMKAILQDYMDQQPTLFNQAG